jgi:hypothetical protein
MRQGRTLQLRLQNTRTTFWTWRISVGLGRWVSCEPFQLPENNQLLTTTQGMDFRSQNWLFGMVLLYGMDSSIKYDTIISETTNAFERSQPLSTKQQDQLSILD